MINEDVLRKFINEYINKGYPVNELMDAMYTAYGEDNVNSVINKYALRFK